MSINALVYCCFERTAALVRTRFFGSETVGKAAIDPSVARCREEALRPTHLLDCMRTFTKLETISGDDLPYCSKCKEVRADLCLDKATRYLLKFGVCACVCCRSVPTSNKADATVEATTDSYHSFEKIQPGCAWPHAQSSFAGVHRPTERHFIHLVS